VCDSLFIEVLIPVIDQFLAQVICLVNAKNKLFFLINFRNIFLQVSWIEKVWVSSVDYLKEEIWLLNDTPKLFPHFNVLFEGRNCKLDVVFFKVCDISPPFQKRDVFLLSNFCFRHFLCPMRPSWNFQSLILGISDVLLVQELVENHLLVLKRVNSSSIWNYCVRLNNLSSIPYSFEFPFWHLSNLHEFFQTVLLENRL